MLTVIYFTVDFIWVLSMKLSLIHEQRHDTKLLNKSAA